MSGYSLKVVLNKGGRKNKRGLYSIYLQVIIARRAYHFNLDKKIERIHWQGKDNFWIKPSHRYSTQLNIVIKRKVDDVLSYVHRKESMGHFITIDDFRAIFYKVASGTFNEFVDDYMKTKLKGLSVNTIKKYNTFARYLTEFNKEIAYPLINEGFIHDFCHWLHKEKHLHGSTIHKYMDPFRMVVRHAYKEGYYERDPFYGVRIPYTEARKNPKEYLSIAELKRIKEKVIPSSRFVLEKVREWFIFSFYCGIRYKDLIKLKWSDFIETEQGLCLVARRTKNGNGYHVPLYMIRDAIEILNKRRELDPVYVFSDSISEQKYNDHLKELAILADIKKNLRNSSARDAFGKFWARKGIPIQHLARMMGHHNENTTRKYYDIDGEDINEHLDKMKTVGLFITDF